MPVGANAIEGSLLVAVTNGAQAYTFLPAPIEAYECYKYVCCRGVSVAAFKVEHTHTTTRNAS